LGKNRRFSYSFVGTPYINNYVKPWIYKDAAPVLAMCKCTIITITQYQQKHTLYQYTFQLIWLLQVPAGRHLQGAHNQADSNKLVPEDGDQQKQAADR
jgi:hypothetical protein